jgi:hypothetical protein
MSNVTNTGDIFAAFIEADKAIKELPAVREELELTKVDLELTKEERAAAQSKAELLASTIDQLRAELATKEAALAEAMFLRESAESKLAVIASILPSPDRGPVAGASLEAVTKPKEDTTNVSTDPTPTSANSTDTPQLVAAPETATHETVADYTTASTSAELASEASSTHIYPTEVANTATHTSLPTVSHGPTASSTPAHDGSPVGPHSPMTSQHDTSAHKPYLGWSYWERPDHITMERFAELGGSVPSWMLPDRHNVA